jgi:hypothetical protein
VVVRFSGYTTSKEGIDRDDKIQKYEHKGGPKKNIKF